MTGKHAYENRIEILQGTLDMLILQSLQRGPMHGYGIAHMIRSKTSDVLQIETGSLYPALHRLERQRWVKSKWDVTDSKQRAKFYTITPLGKRQMISDHERWQALVKAVGAIMSPEQEPL